MAQGDDKTGQKGTNLVFVMTHAEIDGALKAGHKWTYARIVADYRPRKEDPTRIRISVGGNIITYMGKTSTRTADLTTSKLLWNSILSTKGGQIYVPGPKEFLPDSSVGLLQIHENTICIIPRMDQKII